MTDNTGMFEDFCFKLVVIDRLLEENPSFEDELEELKEKYVDDFEWYVGNDIIPEMLAFFENLVLTEDDLAKVTELCFDGGNEVYFLLLPDWDGEDGFFDVTSIKGFEKLTNLKEVEYISMCELEILKPFTEHGITVDGI